MGRVTLKTFYLARRTDGHRFEGTKITAYSEKHAEEVYARLKFILTGLIIVGGKR